MARVLMVVALVAVAACVGRGDAAPPPAMRKVDDIRTADGMWDVWHDDARSVTCWRSWSGGVGIACLPDSVVGGRP